MTHTVVRPDRANRMMAQVRNRRAGALSFKSLTEEQARFVTNGCGRKGGWVAVPQFRFRASCNHHDFAYWRGGSRLDRKRADRQFLLAMIDDALSVDGLDQFVHIVASLTYYAAVRLCGWRCFHFGTPRGIADLRRAIGEA